MTDIIQPFRYKMEEIIAFAMAIGVRPDMVGVNNAGQLDLKPKAKTVKIEETTQNK